MVPDPLAFLDLEVGEGRVIEVGVLRVEDGRVVGAFSTLVNPRLAGVRCPIAWNQHVHGIDTQQVRRAPDWGVATLSLVPWVHDAVLVAHNASFERRFWPWRNARWLDTLRLARVRWPGLSSYSLTALCERLGIQPGGHRALADAWAMAQVMSAMLR